MLQSPEGHRNLCSAPASQPVSRILPVRRAHIEPRKQPHCISMRVCGGTTTRSDTAKMLRVKTGCLRCRKRRKKCDETKPICSACKRWDFACIWPGSGDDSPPSSEHPSSLARAISSHGCSAFRDQTQFTFLQNFAIVYQTLICPLAGSEYKNVNQVVVISLREAWIRDALNAFTGYMLFSKTSDTKMKEKALSSYQMAVVGLKDKLCHPIQKGEELPIIVAATFLGLVEGLGTGNSDLAIAHFALVARLGQSIFAKPCTNEAIIPLYRIILEHLVCNLAVNALFHPVPDAVLQALDWSDHDRFFHQPQEVKSPRYRLSPHLAGNHEIYQMVLDITCFSRRDHCQKTRTNQVNVWLLRIDHLERRLQSYYLGAPEAPAAMFTAKYQLYILALRIYCFKVRDHNLHPCNSIVTREVQQAQTIFMESPLRHVYHPGIAWPFVVLMCACFDYTTFYFFVREVEMIKMNFDPGHRRHLDEVIQVLDRTFQIKRHDQRHSPPDNLQLLLDKDGVTEPYL